MTRSRRDDRPRVAAPPRAAAVVLASLVIDVACHAPAASSGGEPLAPPAVAARPVAAGSGSPGVDPAPEPSAAPSAARSVVAPAVAAAGGCPGDMVRVVHVFCPAMQRHCLDSEYEPSNHLTICHRFAADRQRCLEERVRLDFCVDRYEFPNLAGAHPPVMIDWNEADRLCASVGKRLCTEHEWTAACEGPDELPFPYGHSRDPSRCNIDNPWISPQLSRLHSRNPAIRDAELARLDQGVPSGARPGCVSGFGVHDLTGNFDEWVRAEPLPARPLPHAAALKGGAWGHVRNACRPVTTSHAPSFVYYFVSTRCCRDPAPSDGG